VAAFRASLGGYNEGEGIYKGSGGPLTTIFDTTQDPTFYSGFANYPSINDDGTVAFNARRSGVWGLYAGQGGALSTIAAPPDPYAAGGYGIPRIAADGTVFYSASTSTESGVYSNPSGLLNPILSASPQDAIYGLAVSNNGRVAFITPGLNGIARGAHVTGPDGALPLVTISALNNLGYGYDSIAVNDAGLVGLVGSISFFNQGVYLGEGGGLTTVVDRNSPFNSFGSVSLNNLGQVAFAAALDSGPSGIFTGPNPDVDKVIQTGDTLDGSLVTRISFGSAAFNDAGQIAFYALLADGRRGVYVASVPEPSSLLLASLGGAAVLAVTAVRRRANRRGTRQ
jgi:hypothetical protein